MLWSVTHEATDASGLIVVFPEQATDAQGELRKAVCNGISALTHK